MTQWTLMRQTQKPSRNQQRNKSCALFTRCTADERQKSTQSVTLVGFFGGSCTFMAFHGVPCKYRGTIMNISIKIKVQKCCGESRAVFLIICFYWDQFNYWSMTKMSCKTNLQFWKKHLILVVIKMCNYKVVSKQLVSRST